MLDLIARLLYSYNMFGYRKINRLLRTRMAQEGLSLRDVGDESGINYGMLWRLLYANNNKERFKKGKGKKNKVIMNLTLETVDKLCKYLNKKPWDLLTYKKDK